MRRLIILVGILVFVFSVLVQPSLAWTAVTTTNTPSTVEITTMMFIREEEKLARDVYSTLNDIWNQKVFTNIAVSEQRHMDAIKSLLDHYGLEDPVINNDVGAFENEMLDKLYDDLIEWGSTSLEDAFLVGIFIEEYDILDLNHAIGLVDEALIKKVYEALCNGSYNHLSAFVRNYEQKIGPFSQDVLIETLEELDLGLESLVFDDDEFDEALEEADTQKQNQLGK